MDVKKRTEAFVELGRRLSLFSGKAPAELLRQNPVLARIRHQIENGHILNPWFTPENIRESILSIAEMLKEENLISWISGYPELQRSNRKKIAIGVISAGNLPLVGFHDFLCVLISGNKYLGKLSSKDDVLPVCMADLLIQIEPEFASLISFPEGNLHGFDAVIATGSNNSARYFEYYFGKYPHIIRKNRNAIAILDGYETEDELRLLADDIFMYFGLGCRNVSKVYIPEGYDPKKFMPSLEAYAHLRNHYKYMNNYEYNRAILLINQAPHLDNGFLLVKEDETIASPIGVLNYQYYPSVDWLNNHVQQHIEQLQCVAGHIDLPFGTIPFGKAQHPGPADYADHADTIDFLLKLDKESFSA